MESGVNVLAIARAASHWGRRTGEKLARYRGRVVVESEGGAERAVAGVDGDVQLPGAERRLADAGSAARRAAHVRAQLPGADLVVDGPREVAQPGRQDRAVALAADGRQGGHGEGDRGGVERDGVVNDGRVGRQRRV